MGQAAVGFSELSNQIAVLSCDYPGTTEPYAALLYERGLTSASLEYFERALKHSAIPNLTWALYIVNATHNNKASQAKELIRQKVARFPEDLWATQLIGLATGDLSIEESLRRVRRESS